MSDVYLLRQFNKSPCVYFDGERYTLTDGECWIWWNLLREYLEQRFHDLEEKERST